MKKIKPAITLGILGMVLTVGICVQLKTIDVADIGSTLILSDSNLKKSLLQWKETYNESKRKLEDTNNQLEEIKNSISNLEIDSELQQKNEKYEIILGMTDVSGEGIEITLADNTEMTGKNTFYNIDSSKYLVHDGNLVSIVNELKAGGAEAISINGKRIIGSTCITCAGNVIQINGEKIGSPFIIKAIGAKDLLYGETTKNEGTLYKLKKYGIITNIEKKDKVEIQKEL